MLVETSDRRHDPVPVGAATDDVASVVRIASVSVRAPSSARCSDHMTRIMTKAKGRPMMIVAVERVLSVYPAMHTYQRDYLPEKWCTFSGTRAAMSERTPELQEVLDAETDLLRARHAELVAGLGLGPADSERLTRQLVVYNGLLAQMLRDPYEEAIDEAEATARVLVAAALA